MHEKRIGRGLLVLLLGDITESGADAVVNAANNHLWMGAGVAGAIKRKGGVAIEEEARSKAPIPVGEAVATGGGALKARHVIHAAGMGQDLKTSGEIVASCTAASLRCAEALGLASIAFPAIGTGVGGLPVDEAARRMLRASADHLRAGGGGGPGGGPGSKHRHGGLERIEFVLFGEDDFEAFASALEDV